jgi:hypothetical protein
VILGLFSLDRGEASTSFRRLADLDVEVGRFGHGDPVVGETSSRLRAAASALAEQ